MALEKELETYKAKLPTLKDEEGKFVLVSGEDLKIFSSYDEAIKEGYSRYGLNPFLVKKVEAFEQALFISRFLDPCSAH